MSDHVQARRIGLHLFPQHVQRVVNHAAAQRQLVVVLCERVQLARRRHGGGPPIGDRLVRRRPGLPPASVVVGWARTATRGRRAGLTFRRRRYLRRRRVNLARPPRLRAGAVRAESPGRSAGQCRVHHCPEKQGAPPRERLRTTRTRYPPRAAPDQERGGDVDPT